MSFLRWAIIGLAVAACSPTARVHIDDETALRGRLLPDGDEEVVTIEVNAEPIPVRADHIERVQLPGQGLMLSGLAMMEGYLHLSLITFVPILRNPEYCMPDLGGGTYCEEYEYEGAGLALAFASPLAFFGGLAFIWGLVLRRRAARQIRGHQFRGAPADRALSIFGPTGLAFDLSL